jgi:hypothetical protein
VARGFPIFVAAIQRHGLNYAPPPTLATVAVTSPNKYRCIILYGLTCMCPLTF